MIYSKYNMVGANSMPVQKVKPFNCAPASAGASQNTPVSLKITNTTDLKRQYKLFDAAAASQLKDGVQTQSGVTIEGITLNYQNFLNRLASNDQYCITGMRLEVPSGQEAQLQEVLTVIKDLARSNQTNTEAEFYPFLSVTPDQENKNIVIVPGRFDLNRSITVLSEILPKTELNITFYIGGGIELA